MAQTVIIAITLIGCTLGQVGSWQTLAGYQTATDVGPHSMIDLDMEEIENMVDGYSTSTTWRDDALFVYENGGNSVKSTGTIRTLKGFATKDYSALDGDYAMTYPKIYGNYWNDYSYADTFITKDYSNIVKDVGAAELIKKSASYQAIWMYVLHRLQDAVGDCYAGDIYANDGTPTGGAPHAWDEGWAFYTGSLVGATAANAVAYDGTLIWELAEKRGIAFGTTHSTGPSTVNVNALAAAISGLDFISSGQCANAEPLVDEFRKQMTVPLVQSVLKYAWRADPANGDKCFADAGKSALTASDDCVESWAEGWAFAAAVLPQVHECDLTAAATIRANLDITAAGPVADGFAAVKTAIESTLACMGITCADVGAYVEYVHVGGEACSDPPMPTLAPTPTPSSFYASKPSGSSSGSSGGGDGIMLVVGGVLVLLAAAAFFFFCRSKGPAATKKQVIRDKTHGLVDEAEAAANPYPCGYCAAFHGSETGFCAACSRSWLKPEIASRAARFQRRAYLALVTLLMSYFETNDKAVLSVFCGSIGLVVFFWFLGQRQGGLGL